ncbi:permease [Nocardia lijiangensis]|uniref:permease n=1 Tax=Nocardia lijiangensis TaxID=299618 RepID=UPI0008349B24|nr:permease [Nocardia lijiangensis]
MTSSEVRPDGKSSASVWRNRIIGGVALLVVLVVTYLILAAFIPRWWAQRLAEMVSGSFSKGIGWGLFFGGVCTLVALLLLLFAVLMWRKRAGKFLAGAAVLLAVLVLIPNLMTLSIVLGASSAAHAGQRILDVDAPAFRGAGLVGAIIAALLFAGAVFLVVRRQMRRKKAAKQIATAPETGAAPAQAAPDATPTRHNRL